MTRKHPEQRTGKSRDDYGTPDSVFLPLNREFHFTLDAAATAENTKCKLFISPEQNALSCNPWPGGRGAAFLNPPYGRKYGGTGKWIERAWAEAQIGARTVVCLVPARTDTAWWHNIVRHRADSVHFVKGRVTFIGAPNPAWFPSVIVVFKPTDPPNGPTFHSFAQDVVAYASAIALSEAARATGKKPR